MNLSNFAALGIEQGAISQIAAVFDLILDAEEKDSELIPLGCAIAVAFNFLPLFWDEELQEDFEDIVDARLAEAEIAREGTISWDELWDELWEDL